MALLCYCTKIRRVPYGTVAVAKFQPIKSTVTVVLLLLEPLNQSEKGLEHCSSMSRDNCFIQNMQANLV